jgi:hypothetical protein
MNFDCLRITDQHRNMCSHYFVVPAPGKLESTSSTVCATPRGSGLDRQGVDYSLGDHYRYSISQLWTTFNYPSCDYG